MCAYLWFKKTHLINNLTQTFRKQLGRLCLMRPFGILFHPFLTSFSTNLTPIFIRGIIQPIPPWQHFQEKKHLKACTHTRMHTQGTAWQYHKCLVSGDFRGSIFGVKTKRLPVCLSKLGEKNKREKGCFSCYSQDCWLVVMSFRSAAVCGCHGSQAPPPALMVKIWWQTDIPSAV